MKLLMATNVLNAVALAVVALGGGCHSAPRAPGDGGPSTIDVHSLVAGCSSLDDCERACSSGKPAACVETGRLYEYGHGVGADAAKAFRLYEKACAKGYSGGCYNVALLLDEGRGTPRDAARSRELYAKVCLEGSQTACAKMAAVVEDRGDASAR